MIIPPTACRHALCTSHQLRELTYLEQQYQQGMARDLKRLLLEMKAAEVRARAQQQTCPHCRERRVRRTLRRAPGRPPSPSHWPTAQPRVCLKVYLESSLGQGQLRGIPGLTPLDHLSNLSALRIHNRPRDAPNIGVAAPQQRHARHLNGGRMMGNHGIEERAIKGPLLSELIWR